MFQAGDLVIYGREGVCKIMDIDTPEISGIDKNRLYYALRPLYHSEKIYVPVDSNVFMRPVISYEEAEALIESIPDVRVSICNEVPMKLLEATYKNYIDTHDCKDLIILIKNIYIKKTAAAEKGTKLSRTDEKFMKNAEGLLYGEFGAVLGIPKENVKAYIENRIPKIIDPQCKFDNEVK